MISDNGSKHDGVSEGESSRMAAWMPFEPERRKAFIEALERNGYTGVVQYAARDMHELDEALRSGRFDAVAFASLNDLLNGIWNDDANPPAWRDRNVDILILEPDFPKRRLVEINGTEFLINMHQGLSAWRIRQRGRKRATALVLSILAMIAIAVLMTV